MSVHEVPHRATVNQHRHHSVAGCEASLHRLRDAHEPTVESELSVMSKSRTRRRTVLNGRTKCTSPSGPPVEGGVFEPLCLKKELL